MKQTIIFFLITFCAIANLSAQADFNYSFYPSPAYAKYQALNKIDTLAKAVKIQSDTTKDQINVLIEKQNGLFSIRKLSNLSDSFYSRSVVFVRFDELGDMLYQAISEERETIKVNPLKGTVEIMFQKCFDEPQAQPSIVKKHCDIVRHLFGNHRI